MSVVECFYIKPGARICLKSAPDDSLLLEEELELEATKERKLGLSRENWGLGDIKRSLLLVDNDTWFQQGGGMIDLRVLGPSRPSTFMRVFSDVPGAIYGCLKVRMFLRGQYRSPWLKEKRDLLLV